MTINRKLIEPAAAEVPFMNDSDRATYSCAVSLKRIADRLNAEPKIDELCARIEELRGELEAALYARDME